MASEMASRRFTHYSFNNFVGMSDDDLVKARRHSTANVRLDPIPLEAHSPTVKIASETAPYHDHHHEKDLIISDPWTPLPHRAVSPRRRGRVDPLPVIPGIVSVDGPQSAPHTTASTAFAPQPGMSSGLRRRAMSVSPTQFISPTEASNRRNVTIVSRPRRASVLLHINGRDAANTWEARTPAELIASLRKEARGY